MYSAAMNRATMDSCFLRHANVTSRISQTDIILDFDSLSFARASSAMDFNNSGVLQSYGSNILRKGYDPITLLPVGALIEGAATNLFPSQVFSNPSQITSVTGLPDTSGGTAAVGIIPTTANASHYLDRTIAVAAGTVASFSVEVTSGAANKVRLAMYGTGNATFSVEFDLVAGTFAAPAFSAEYTSGGGTFVGASMVRIGTNKWRCAIVGLPDTAAITRLCRLLVLNIAGTTSVFAGDGVTTYLTYYGPQLETLHTTSYVPTPSGSASRSTDLLKMDGEKFNSVFGVGAPTGCIIVDALMESNTGHLRHIVQLDDGGPGTNRIAVRPIANGLNLLGVSAQASIIINTAQIPYNLFGSLFRVGLRWGSGTYSVCCANQIANASYANLSLNTMRVGSDQTLGAMLSGRVKRIRALNYSPNDNDFLSMCALAV